MCLATIKPIHSLVAGVMEGVGKPELLIGGALSEHSYELKPSDARKIQRASGDLRGRAGSGNLSDGAAGGARPARIVALEQAPDVRLIAARRGGLWGNDRDEGPTDPHIWLDPQNAIAMTGAIADALERADPAHAGQYRVNAARQVASLTLSTGNWRRGWRRSATDHTSSSTMPITISSRATDCIPPAP